MRALKITALTVGGVLVVGGVVTYIGLLVAASAFDDLLVGVGEQPPQSPSPFQDQVWLS